MKHFFILGNASSGTSLLRGLMNAHPRCIVDFEFWDKTSLEHSIQMYDNFCTEAEAENKLWGNKLPLEMIIWANAWGINDNNNEEFKPFLELAERYYILFIRRNFEGYKHSMRKRHAGMFMHGIQSDIKLLDQHTFGLNLIYHLKAMYPKKIKSIKFENLILDTKQQLKSICDFLDLDYNDSMLAGTKDTGFHSYDRDGIDKTILAKYH